jgi:hypothetical protein
MAKKTPFASPEPGTLATAPPAVLGRVALEWHPAEIRRRRAHEEACDVMRSLAGCAAAVVARRSAEGLWAGPPSEVEEGAPRALLSL